MPVRYTTRVEVVCEGLKKDFPELQPVCQSRNGDNCARRMYFEIEWCALGW
jgi:hypothetical protein